MTARVVAILACRIFSLWLGLRALPPLQHLFRLIWIWVRDGAAAGQVAYVLPATALEVVVLGGLGGFLWVRAPWLADKMLPGGRAGASHIRLTARDVHTVAVSVVGLVILTQTLPELARAVLVLQAAAEAQGGLGSFNNLWAANAGIALLKAALGGLLWIKARWIAERVR